VQSVDVRSGLSYQQLSSVTSGQTLLSEHFLDKFQYGFSLVYDFDKMRIILVSDMRENVDLIARATPGLSFTKIDPCEWPSSTKISAFEGLLVDKDLIARFANPRLLGKQERLMPVSSSDAGLLSDLVHEFRSKPVVLVVSFGKAESHEVVYWKKRLESRVKAAGYNIFRTLAAFSNISEFAVDQAELLSISNCISAGSHGFFVSFRVFGDASLVDSLSSDLRGRLHRTYDISPGNYWQYGFPDPKGRLLSSELASKFILLSHDFALEMTPVSLPPLPPGLLSSGLGLGNELLDGFVPGRLVSFDVRNLNRHAILAGLQGSGKTNLALQLAKDALRQNSRVIVFSTTQEWSALARMNEDLLVLRFSDENFPINLFRTPKGPSVQLYYQELAELLASSMDAGPYAAPLRAMMLNCFRKLYADNKDPNLKDVFEALFETASNRYRGNAQYETNIRASLELLRELMENPALSADRGLDVEDFMDKSIVFDFSGVSDLLRPLLYVVILAQVYAYSLSNFDERGNDELRLLIVQEEAQKVFGKSEKRNAYENEQNAEAIHDTEIKLGDFRKHGIGLLFLTHFADRLDPGLVRHCQNHFIFKQDSEGATQAVSTLALDKSNDKELMAAAKARISTFDVGECACLLVGEKHVSVPPFFLPLNAPLPLKPLNSFEITARVEAEMKKRGLKRPKKEVVTLSADRWAGFSDPELCQKLLRLIGSGQATTATDFKPIRGIGFKYKAGIDELLSKGLIDSRRRESGTNVALVYHLTPRGVDKLHETDSHVSLNPSGELGGHALMLEKVVECFPGFRLYPLLTSYARPGTLHESLGVMPKQAGGSIDLVLEKELPDIRTLFLFEFETGNNRGAQLYTNLTKLAHNTVGYSKALNNVLSGKPKPVQVKGFWVAKTDAVKKRLLRSVWTYGKVTQEHFQLTVCTLKELREGKASEIVL